MIDFNKYDNIILDFDGVVLDSNEIKKSAIYKASKGLLNDSIHTEFVNYFVSHNGLPREFKIQKYTSEKKDYMKILERYNETLKKELLSAKYTESFDIFLHKLHYYNLKVYILSGGDLDEIKALLHTSGFLEEFELVMGGPLTKYENLNRIVLPGQTLYIGDSKIDFEVAESYGMDFVFMYGYTQFGEYKEYFKRKKNVTIIKNLQTFTYSSC